MLLPKLSKNTAIVIYKLLYDTLFLLLLFFLFALVAEGLVMGIITSHISFLKIIFLIFLNLATLYLIAFFSKITVKEKQPNKKTTIFLVALGTLLVFNSLLKLNVLLAFFILILTAIIGYFIYKIFFSDLI